MLKEEIIRFNVGRIDLPERYSKKFEQLCAEEHRSMSNMASVIVMRYLKGDVKDNERTEHKINQLQKI